MVYQFAIVFVCCVVFSVHANPLQPAPFSGPRIIGGQVVKNRNEVPYQASLRINNRHACGATILDSEHVVTAAHCCFDKKKILPARVFTVVVGDLKLNNPTIYTMKKYVTYVFPHSKYNHDTIANDIAVLRIKGNFGNFTSMVQPLRLARRLPSVGTGCKVSGWGVTNASATIPNDLYAAQVPILDKKTCKQSYKDGIKSGMFCAGYPIGGVDSCQGDSGGPLMCNGELAGVVSWGQGCALRGKPGVYTDVSEYLKWISKQQSRSSSEITVASILTIVITKAVFHLV